MNQKINCEILNDFINMIVMDVAQKYVFKLKNEKKKPPKLIEEYLDEAILLIKKYQTLEISKMKNTIVDIDTKQQLVFNQLFLEDQEYEWLCKELNFAYLLIIDESLQDKTLDLLYDNVYEYKILVNQDLITKKQIKIDNVIKCSNEEKIDRLHFYKHSTSSSMLTI